MYKRFSNSLKLCASLLALCLITLPGTAQETQQHAEQTQENNSSEHQHSELKIPTLGNTSSSLISIEQERKLGKAWLRALRQHTQTYNNPSVKEYLSNLVYKLAPNSGVLDTDFTIVIVNNPELNAFAVPGSIIGINAGLFFHAASEQEFASVIAHELAHLSQRHYARQLEQQQTTRPIALLGILGSVILAATTGSDAGMAALASTQALSVDAQLRFSRKNEQEADRLGIQIMHQSNFNPRAMPIMFERMHKQARLRADDIPEYLSTHPLSDTRITDTRNRADQLPQQHYYDDIEFHLAKSMVIADFAETEDAALKYFENVVEKGNTKQIDAALFGLAYTKIDSAPKEAIETLNSLLKKYNNNITLQITLAKALFAHKSATEALDLLRKQLARNPNNYSISFTLAETYLEANQIIESEAILKRLATQHSENPRAWYLLAEVSGLAGNIVALHEARAEYFFLTNRMNQAIEQIGLAIKKNSNSLTELKLQSRMDYFIEVKKKPLL